MTGWPAVTLPDAEGAVRSWLRGLGLAGGRVFFAVPEAPANEPIPMPLVTVTRAGGAPDDELPIDQALLLFSVWGTTKREAAEAAGSLVTILRAAAGVVTDQMTLDSVSGITGPVWTPDDDAHQPRYIVTATFNLRPAVV